MEAIVVAFSWCSVVAFALAFLRRTDPAVSTLLASMAPPVAAGPRAGSTLARLGRTRWASGAKQDELLRRLELAGSPWPIDVVRGSKVAFAAGGLFVAIPLALLSPVAAAIPLLAGAAMYRAPDIALARMAKRRQSRIAVQVADFAELLVATTRAGLTPVMAFRRSAEALRGPLGDELAMTVDQIELGVPWREGIRELCDRLPDASMRRLVDALIRTQRLGTSVLSALRTVGDDLRAERKARAEEAARRAPVKMLFPLVFLILPAFLLLTVGPVVMATVRSLR